MTKRSPRDKRMSYYNHRPPPQFVQRYPRFPARPPHSLHSHSPGPHTHTPHTLTPPHFTGPPAHTHQPATQPSWPHISGGTVPNPPQPLFIPRGQHAMPMQPMYPPYAFQIPAMLPPRPGSPAPLMLPSQRPVPDPSLFGAPLSSPGPSLPPAEPVDPFVMDWLKAVGERRAMMTQEQDRKRLTIPEARSLLSRSSYLVTTLRSFHTLLSTIPDGDQSTWESFWTQVQQCKSELESIRGNLTDPEVSDHLVKKVQRVSAKRERSKHGRRVKKAEKRERMSQAEQSTDQWLSERRQEELRQKTEESVGASARCVLEEVKRKQTEIKQYQDLLAALDRLREHRKENRKKGEVLPFDMDEVYTQKYKSLDNLLSRQISEYEREEHTLRVLMKEEVKEKMSSQQKQLVEKPPVVTMPPPSVNPPWELPPAFSDPLQPHRQYWLQAESSEQCKANIRQGWSCYQHPEGTPLPDDHQDKAPSVSAPAWEQFIAQNTCQN